MKKCNMSVEEKASKFANHVLNSDREIIRVTLIGMYENIHYTGVERNSWRELALRWRDWFKWEKRNHAS